MLIKKPLIRGFGGIFCFSNGCFAAGLADIIMSTLENIAEMLSDFVAGATEGVNKIRPDVFIAHFLALHSRGRGLQ